MPKEERALLRKQRQPDWIPPMLATLTDRRFSDPEWVFEWKLDGVRGLAFRRGTTVRLLSRNRLALSGYPEIVEALADQPADDIVVDGEVVAFHALLRDLWTVDGRLRHPRFLLLRRDKEARDVVRERPAGSAR